MKPNFLKNTVKTLTCLSTLICATQSFAVNGALDYGFSEITRGMGGAGSALPQDSLIAAINPAGMVRIKKQLDLGVIVYVPTMSYDATTGQPACIPPGCGLIIAPGHSDSKLAVFVLPDFGINLPLNKKSSVGFSLYSVGGFGGKFETNASGKTPAGSIPGPLANGTLRTDLKQSIASLTYAHTFLKHSSWGVSFLIGMQALKARGVNGLNIYSVAPNNVSGKGTDYSVGAGVRFGVLFGVLHNLDLAVSYQPKVYMTKLSAYKGLLPNGGEFDMPAFGNIGLAWHITHSIVLAADIEKIWFKDIPAYGNSNLPITPGGSCPPGTGGASDTCMGAKNGSGFAWNNNVIYKAGVQWAISPKTTLRAGFNHSDRLLSDNAAIENLITPGALIRNLITAGFTRVLSKRDSINGVLAFIPYQHFTSNNLSSGTTNQQKLTINADGWGVGISWSHILG